MSSPIQHGTAGRNPTAARPKPWEHSHSFGQDRRRPGETRTLIVIAITGLMMVIEVVAGIVYGSMALLADGLHMASHAAALTINALAYIYARRHAHDARWSFGTGKVNTLGGYTGAVLLAVFALVMAWESTLRFIDPVPIAFNQAIFVAVLGLIVNGVSVVVLGHHHHPEAAHDLVDDFEEHAHYHDGHEYHGHEHDHGHAHAHAGSHEHDHAQEHGQAQTFGHVHTGDPADDHDHGHPDGHGHYHAHDHNLVSAYLHVLADAVTSLLAIFALVVAKYFGWVWADPVMGIVGSILVARWSIGLLHSTAVVLLDREGPDDLREMIRRRIEADGDNALADLHLWAVGPQMYSAILSVVTSDPRPAEHYKSLLPRSLGIVHIVVEVHAAKAS